MWECPILQSHYSVYCNRQISIIFPSNMSLVIFFSTIRPQYCKKFKCRKALTCITWSNTNNGNSSSSIVVWDNAFWVICFSFMLFKLGRADGNIVFNRWKILEAQMDQDLLGYSSHTGFPSAMNFTVSPTSSTFLAPAFSHREKHPGLSPSSLI